MKVESLTSHADFRESCLFVKYPGKETFLRQVAELRDCQRLGQLTAMGPGPGLGKSRKPNRLRQLSLCKISTFSACKVIVIVNRGSSMCKA